MDTNYHRYHRFGFIADDPISVPHTFELKQDIEIAAFITAIISWGNRKSIIKSAKLFLQLMDNDPFSFIKNHRDSDLKGFENFKHRTFLPPDALGFIAFLNNHYQKNESLESAFLDENLDFISIYDSLINLRKNMFSDPTLMETRTNKHVANPQKKSTCKRLNMFLRWMVRKNEGVDFGLWHKIPTSALMMPLDVHVERIGRMLGLIKRTQSDWLTVEELTGNLAFFDPMDPVKYDYALFGMGLALNREKSSL